MVNMLLSHYDRVMTTADGQPADLPAPTGAPLPAPTTFGHGTIAGDGRDATTGRVLTGPASILLSWGTCTHPGKVRRLNEDSFLATPPVFIVADGMGGHAGGDVASALAVDAMAKLTRGQPVRTAEVNDAVRSANAAIAAHASSREQVMGTTLSGLVVGRSAAGDDVLLANVGDSRTYLWRAGALVQLSVDHSHVQELVDAGRLDPADVAHHPERNVVTRALGIDVDVDVDIRSIQVLPGDRFVVCSDGLTSEVPDAAIAAELGHPDVCAVAEGLVARVLAGRAGDNVTVVVVDVVAIEREACDADRTDPRPQRSMDQTEQRPPPALPTVDLIDAVPLDATTLTASRAQEVPPDA